MLWTCRVLRIPVVLHLHASEYPEFFDALPKLAKALLRRTFAGADVVVVLGEKWRDYVCCELRVPPAKVAIMLNAAPGPGVAPQARARGSDPLRILFLGRLGTRKGVPEILHALADTRLCGKQWFAVMAGDGDIARYSAEAERLGIGDRVSFTGWIDADEARKLLSDSDLLLLPSHAEGLPMSIVEAFAHGVPVVSTRVGAIADILEDGVNGLFVETGSSSQLADVLLKLVEDEPLRLLLARNARATWEERLDVTSYGRALALCWRHALASSHPAYAGISTHLSS
jgi:glycosyltransferase involved in cell wall biosynthesis